MTLDPARFRVSKGRGARWYVDDLGPCPIVPDADPAHPFEAPSWTTVAGAWPKFLVPWASGLVADTAVYQPDLWRHLEPEAAIAVLKDTPNRVRDAAAVRGTSIHKLLEQIAIGQEPMEELIPDAAPFLPTLRRYVIETRPRWILSECVGFNRGIGYGATTDAVKVHDALPELGTCWVDYKTRLAVRCYPENAAQVVAHSGFEYVMVDGQDGPERARPPVTDGGLVVVITPDEYALFPVTTGADALDGIRRLRDFWAFFRSAGSLIGKPVGVPSSEPMTQLLRSWLVARVKAIAAHGPVTLNFLAACWPQGVPTLKQSDTHDGAQLAAIEAVLDLVEKECSIPFGEPRPAPTGSGGGTDHGQRCDPSAAPTGSVSRQPPARAPLATEAACSALIARLRALPSDLLAVVEAKAADQKIPNLRSGRATVDELAMVDVAVMIVEAEAEVRRQRTVDILGEFAAHELGIVMCDLASPGVDKGTLTATELEHLQAIVEATNAGVLMASFDNEGTCSLVPTPNVEALLLSAYGSKSNLLAAAKGLGERIGMTVPRSASAVCKDPLLAALLFASQMATTAA